MDHDEIKSQLYQVMMDRARRIPLAKNKRDKQTAEREWREAAKEFLSYGRVPSSENALIPMHQMLLNVVNELVPAGTEQIADGSAWS